MEIVNPPRIVSLQPRSIQVIQHLAYEHSVPLELNGVFPFMTVHNLKQFIALEHNDAKEWLPNLLFLAVEEETGFRPIEFSWSFASSLADPLTPATAGDPDPRIYKDDARDPTQYPTLFPGAKLESVLQWSSEVLKVHVWNYSSVAAACGYSDGALPVQSAFEGYLQLYFPALDSYDELRAVFTPLSDAEKEVFSVAAKYKTAVEKRLTLLEAALKHPQVNSAPAVELNQLREVVFNLPSKPNYTKQTLELKFYETEPSANAPFMRFFPAKDRNPPLGKVYTTASGASAIPSSELMNALMAIEPAVDMMSVFMIMCPITTSAGAAWVLSILEDGSASLALRAPQKKKPIFLKSYLDAVKVLPDFLAATPWADAQQLTLVKLDAAYGYRAPAALEKPSKAELRARYNVLVPLFLEDRVPPGDSAIFNFRYKAVDNYAADKDPVMNFITHLYFRETAESAETLPIQYWIVTIAQEFGIAPTEASTYIQRWISRNSEYIQSGDSASIPVASLGSGVGLYNNHPKYIFNLMNVESVRDLERIVSCMTVLTSLTAEMLGVEGSAERASAAVQAANIGPAEAPPVEEAPPEGMTEEEMMMMLAGMGHMGDMEEAAEEHIEEAVPVAPAAPIAPAELPKALKEGEVLPPLTEFYLSRLKEADKELFGYEKEKDDKRVTVYSRACQSSQNKQPNVMAPETYNRARAIYGDSVFWMEAPLEGEDLFISNTVYKSVKERKKEFVRAGKSMPNEGIRLEKRALEIGLPLGGGKSIASLPEYEKLVSEATKLELEVLLAAQEQKPLWTVIRLGTKLDMPNYFICAELWCARDDLPLIVSQFEQNTHGSNCCPFCGGTEIKNMLMPAPGETVVRRKPTAPGGKVAKYSGIQDALNHKDRFALPCCFADPNMFGVPVGAMPTPPPKIALPPAQQQSARNGGVEEHKESEAPPPPKPVGIAAQAAAAAEAENRARPFSPFAYRPIIADGKFTLNPTSTQNPWFIPAQNILGRSTDNWFELEASAAAVPPSSVNKLLGQDPEKFLTKIKGAFIEKINSYLAYPASAFVRMGISNPQASAGENFLALLAYARYAIDHLNDQTTATKIESPVVIKDIFDEKVNELAVAFLQANYGTLVHEFSRPDRDFKEGEEAKFLSWWHTVGNKVPELDASQRAYGKMLYFAFENFKNYLKTEKAAKDLRLFEGLFATPGLFTKTGFILLRIVYPKDGKNPTIHCPEFGISHYDQLNRPPIILVLEDSVTGLYDPLVLYEGLSKEDRKLIGALQPDSELLGTLSPQLREAIMGFLTQYYAPFKGCGRTAMPVHPWVPELETTNMPLLSDIINAYRKSGGWGDIPDGALYGLLRDRSNRLTGVIISYNRKQFYLPCLDDGYIASNVQNVYGEEAMPRPELADLLDVFAGRSKVTGKKKISKFFPGLRPRALVGTPTEYTGLELACNAVVLIKPFSRDLKITHTIFDDMEKKEIPLEIKDAWPWSTNSELLAYPPIGADSIEQTSEEQLDEAYQHVRITISNWLNNHPMGQRVRKQIDLLRKARSRLPLFELQKRLDLLLYSVVADVLTTDGEPRSFILRRDCLTKSEKDCTGGCSFSGGRCLIHVPPRTERYTNVVRVLTARLVDELLRTFGLAMEVLGGDVPLLRPLTKGTVVKGDSSLMFTAEGRGDASLYERLGYYGRKPSDYTHGYTYPEEIGKEVEDADIAAIGLPADWASVLKIPVFGADVERSTEAKIKAALVLITKKPIADLESRLGTPFRGGDQWADIAVALGLNVIVTRYDTVSERMEYNNVYTVAGGAAAEPKYLVLDYEGVPLQKHDSSFILQESELPASLRVLLG